ncbi:unnamed protein product [Acanthoscelides obtectus]|uniref:Uncharacterized protein n=1 Tax=Acanthoscelides obtectus TaxID=200917 RepID=A0A9P0P7W9_ACAOB|nr:unnamed protein product [Acanthoscelides obtectus]CAK1666843.1 hypothetical protein AOBTE_LOCUS25517 [Acanthoscelides obtectus]
MLIEQTFESQKRRVSIITIFSDRQKFGALLHFPYPIFMY